MFQGIKHKNLILIYAVIGFGSIALVALGELAGVEQGSVLYNFYLRLVFGGFIVFYAVLFHFGTLSWAEKLDKEGPKYLAFMFGEKSSRFTIMTVVAGVLLYWVFSFADLMAATGFNFF